MRYVKGDMTQEANIGANGIAVLRRLGWRPETEVIAERKRAERIAALKERIGRLCQGCRKSPKRCVCVGNGDIE